MHHVMVRKHSTAYMVVLPTKTCAGGLFSSMLALVKMMHYAWNRACVVECMELSMCGGMHVFICMVT